MLRTLAGTALIALAGAASAQYVGPGTASAPRAPATLTQLLQQPTDGLQVRFRGHLLQQLNHNKFLFSDGKSQIRVQINPDQFPPQAIDDKTEVEIAGMVEKDFMETPEIDAKEVIVLPPKQPLTAR
jgi:uncharacterized protein (TIGR00156 family)